MVKKNRKRKCSSCKEYFLPDARNAWHQKFCTKPDCRRASKATSQQLWLQKPENNDYFRCSDNVQRVQKWRKANPDYRQRKSSPKPNALQDVLIEKTSEKQRVSSTLRANALQDILSSQPAVLIGLIGHLTGSALQDDIAKTARNLRQLGNDILNFKGGKHDTKKSYCPQQGTEGSQTVQLGGPSSGP